MSPNSNVNSSYFPAVAQWRAIASRIRTWNTSHEAPESGIDVTNTPSAKCELSMFTFSTKAVLTPSTIAKEKVNIHGRRANC